LARATVAASSETRSWSRTRGRFSPRGSSLFSKTTASRQSPATRQQSRKQTLASSFPAFAVCGLGISDIEFPVPSWGVPLASLQERLGQLSATPQPVSVPPGNSKAATLFRPVQRKVSLVSMARNSRSAGLLRGNTKWSLLDRQRRVQSSNIRKNLTFVGIAPMF